MLQRMALLLLALAAPFGALVLIATDWFPTVAFAIPAAMIGLAVLILAIDVDLQEAKAAQVTIRTYPARLPRRGP